MFIVLVGNVKVGHIAVGPFETETAADEYAAERFVTGAVTLPMLSTPAMEGAIRSELTQKWVPRFGLHTELKIAPEGT